MPLIDGIQATRTILRAGADGFLPKRTRPERLVEAIRLIAAGDALLFPAALRTLIARHAAPPGPAPWRKRLSGREQQVLALMARGLSNTEIAAELVLSPETVKTHVRGCSPRWKSGTAPRRSSRPMKPGSCDPAAAPTGRRQDADGPSR
ncbi:transcriptional regulator, luxR family [Frankia sp. EI5c]|nr:response regulator transcription factor [Frankia sp. EI5c]OAA28084.1 transcriptional regulator, luxR family [Frankia sp. EI5c]